MLFGVLVTSGQLRALSTVQRYSLIYFDQIRSSKSLEILTLYIFNPLRKALVYLCIPVLVFLIFVFS